MEDKRATLVAADLEGVFLPEIWIAVSEATGIKELSLTTRNIANYAELMALRISILRTQQISLRDIQAIIAGLEPLPGARAFIDWIRERTRLIILTDSFYPFLTPFLPKLGYPTIFAHQLVTDGQDMLTGYTLRVQDSKRVAMETFHTLGFRTMAFGDSYNDISMIGAADTGLFFRPPESVMTDFPHVGVAQTYAELQEAMTDFLAEA
ncbi:MAG: bifunctional phosphoserine phosphatase/homoserine phosphotransferase ThrH [Caldilineaceae bacterium]|nr:bifunctional phosphoserine phosphatase/homoserine phosphotransferase ThrH [Caldilineaceae bacterium]